MYQHKFPYVDVALSSNVLTLCQLDGYSHVVAGDLGGTLTALQIHDPALWRVRMEDQNVVARYSSVSVHTVLFE